MPGGIMIWLLLLAGVVMIYAGLQKKTPVQIIKETLTAP